MTLITVFFLLMLFKLKKIDFSQFSIITYKAGKGIAPIPATACWITCKVQLFLNPSESRG